MAYLGMGDVSSSDYVSSGNVCKARNWATLDKFKEMQRQLNRVAGAVGVSKIPVDGDIGSKTINILSGSSGIAARMSMTNPVELALANEANSSCGELASRCETITYFAKAVADSRGVAAGSPLPTSSNGSSGGSTGGSSGGIIPPGTGVAIGPPSSSAAGLWNSVKNMGTTQKLALGIGLLAVGAATGAFDKFFKKRGSGRSRR